MSEVLEMHPNMNPVKAAKIQQFIALAEELMHMADPNDEDDPTEYFEFSLALLVYKTDTHVNTRHMGAMCFKSLVQVCKHYQQRILGDLKESLLKKIQGDA